VHSAKVLVAAGLLIAAGMASPAAASATARPVRPPDGRIGRLLATLHDPGGNVLDTFGDAVAVSGTTAVVGADGASGTGGQPDAGTAYIYVKGTAGWPAQPTVTLYDPPSLDSADFGVSVAASGDTVVIGAGGVQSGGPGVVYVYTKGADGWPATPTATLPDPQFTRDDGFGASVSLSGGTIVAGEPGSTDGNPTGATYVYSEGTAGWPTTPTVTLPPPAAAQDHGFGSAVAVSGGTLAVGTPGAVDGSGLVYLYRHGTTGWPTAPSVTLANPQAPMRNGLGTAVALSGGTLVAGAHRLRYYGEGPVYIFTRGTAGWPASPSATLPDPKSAQFPRDGFGTQVAVSGGITVAGAFLARARGNAPFGRAYVYASTSAGWPSAPTVSLHPAIYSGDAVAVQGTTAVVSALNGASVPGVVFIYHV
jgi:hypothetical protein